MIASDEIMRLARETIPDTSMHHVFYKHGGTRDIINCIKFQFPSAIEQTKEFTKRVYELCGKDDEEFLQTIYNFLVEQVPLMIDPEGVQDIKKPAFLVHKSSKGADCKSYSLFLASVLSNINIPFRFRFCNWQPNDEDAKHVFIEAFPKDKAKKRILDVNMKAYNQEKIPNYNNKYLDMTKICALGKIEGKKIRAKKVNSNSLFDGRPMSRMSDIEIEIRLIRQGLRNERDTLAKVEGIGDMSVSKYDSTIAMTNDLIGEIANITDTLDVKNYEARIAGIGYDFATGEYENIGIGATSVKRRAKLRLRRRNAIKKSNKAMLATPNDGAEWGGMCKSVTSNMQLLKQSKAPTLDSVKSNMQLLKQSKAPTLDDVEKKDAYIGKVFKKIAKKVGKALKTAVKTVGKTVKKTVKAVGKGIVKGAATVAKGVATAAVATTAGVFGGKKGRAAVKKLAKSTAKSAKEYAQSKKELVMAPLAALAETFLEEWAPKIGPFFQNTYLSDAEANKYLTEEGKKKRKKAAKLRKLLIKYLTVDQKAFDKAVKNSVQKLTGKTLEATLQELKDKAEGKATVSGIGMAPGMVSAIISGVMSLLSMILKAVAGKSKGATADFTSLNMSEGDAPNDKMDWKQILAGGLDMANNIMSNVQNSKQSGSSSVSGSFKDVMKNVGQDLLNTAKSVGTQALTNLTNSASNLTSYQLMTGNSTPVATTTTGYGVVDRLTQRLVGGQNASTSAQKALDLVANSPELEFTTPQTANAYAYASAVNQQQTAEKKTNMTPILIGAGALLLGAMILTKKK